ncbi:hypothetical protein [Micromonospora endolithica]|uniref:Uncharacterized protein n=1 Tax=Micromonospora endolithica TaxID=230091 RepID=A0A3A9ZL30_9ACTN|nr:hypothetical protein [Micromonospora endolithica]RKN49072.1 hypothetical protein D7223_05995 [Micromonospora endolithica]TWJ23219.1 hypothetical protein JD76_03354 [Micromonospora endolithica]
MRTVWRNALRTGVVLACLTGVGLAAPTPALAANTTELSGLPDEFRAGDRVETVAAVVRRDRGGCVKVRWSMVLRVQGLRLDQVKVDRVEETGSFPLEIRTEGDTARLTDRQLDPGTLCPDRTVTARYRVAFAEDVTRGRVTLAAEAYDAGLRLLARETATRSVVGARGAATPTSAAPEPTGPTEPPTEEPEAPSTDGEVSDEDAAEVPLPADVPPAAGAGRPVAATGGFGVVQAAFLLGGLLLFLGVGLLLRLRQVTRNAGAADAGSADGGTGLDPVWERPRPRPRWNPARR